MEKITQPECIGHLPGRYDGSTWMDVRTKKGPCGAYLAKELITPICANFYVLSQVVSFIWATKHLNLHIGRKNGSWDCLQKEAARKRW